MTIPVQYPSTARPAWVMREFNPPGNSNMPHEGADIFAPRGTPIVAGAAGDVVRIVENNDEFNYGPYLSIVTKTATDSIRVHYGNLEDIAVSVGETVTVGQLLGYSRGESIKVVIQSPRADAYPGLPMKYIAHPQNHLMLPRLRLKPIDNRLRLRRAPNASSPVAGFVSQWHLLETPSNDYEVLANVGRKGRWIKVINPYNEAETVYAAAWFLKAISLDDPKEGITDIPIRGMNLDRFHAHGTPMAAPLRNLGWVRMQYNLSYNPDNNSEGNTDLNATYTRYQPIFERYAKNGNHLVVVFNHKTFGEGRGYDWTAMTAGQWDDLVTSFVFYVRQIAQQWADKGLVYAYQIWNEQDSPPTSQASVPMPANVYARLFTQTARAIRAVDTEVKIITGGHVTGTELGVSYAQTVLSQIPHDALPDGIGIHSYMTGPMDSPFSYFGTIDAVIEAWSSLLPNKPLWLTEWGILDRQGNDDFAADASDFAEGVIDTCLNDYPGMVACAIWSAWADTMPAGYGMVRSDTSPRQPLYNRYLKL